LGILHLLEFVELKKQQSRVWGEDIYRYIEWNTQSR